MQGWGRYDEFTGVLNARFDPDVKGMTKGGIHGCVCLCIKFGDTHKAK